MQKTLFFFLISTGVALSYKCNAAADGYTKLHLAIIEKDLPQATTLIAMKVDVNAKSTTGTTPLHLAARFSDKQTIDLLIKSGADLNAINTANSTPLDYAKMFNNQEAIELLTSLGAKESRKFQSDSSSLSRYKRKTESYNNTTSKRQKIGGYAYSRHATERASERNASNEDILNTIKQPHKRFMKEDTNVEIFMGPRLKVVTDKREKKIITVIDMEQKDL